ILADLEWLGLRWDGEVTFQSRRLPLYQAALDRLRAMGLLYPCFCTRADIAASASAPHGPEGAVYPGTCRGLGAPDLSRPHCWRLDMGAALSKIVTPDLFRGPPGGERGARGSRPASEEQWTPEQVRGDRLVWNDHGHPIRANPAPQGDVVLARKDAPASYHLAVTIDDAAQHITHIIRGKDLYEATHVHRLLQALLDLPTPEYRHHALLTGPDGQRLAKRHNAPTLEGMRLSGMDGRALADQLRAGTLPVGIASAKA
ncbi:MAG: tRNA glutamyl-Q(34) synthetase GluQRS, partial [Sphingomonadales bacterium]